MSRTQVVTLKTHTYGGKRRQAGDSYSAANSDLRVIHALGWARNALPKEGAPAVVAKEEKPARGNGKAPKGGYQTKVARAQAPAPMAAPTPAPAPAEDPPPSAFLNYGRRDTSAAEGDTE